MRNPFRRHWNNGMIDYLVDAFYRSNQRSNVTTQAEVT
jgi:hypothetical protein